MSFQVVYANARSYLVGIYPGHMLHECVKSMVRLGSQERLFDMGMFIGTDIRSGHKVRSLAVEDFGSLAEHAGISTILKQTFDEFDDELHVVFTPGDGKAAPVVKSELPFATNILVYTNKCAAAPQSLIDAFRAHGFPLRIVEEEDLFQSAFISYGGPDEAFATELNNTLNGFGIKTWFFPIHSVPGDKLHRMMFAGINNHEKVVLICSKTSLTRPGVLNEIERVLEREAAEGGSAILIPVTVDDFVFTSWAPADKKDLEMQLRSRVVVKLNRDSLADPNDKDLTRLRLALSRSRGS